jgi:hypothetical protein
MTPVGFEPAISGGERAQNYALDRTATGIPKYVLSTALQLLVRSFGLLNHFLPSSPILDKGLPIWLF